MFVKQPTKFLLSKIAHAIPKTKSASDIRTARELIGAVKRGYPICIFPEGNTTFNGETTYVEESTMKLIKKLNIDVVTVKVEGGYLSKPRWATSKRKNRRAKFTFKITIPKEQLPELSVEDINRRYKICYDLYMEGYNAYEIVDILKKEYGYVIEVGSVYTSVKRHANVTVLPKRLNKKTIASNTLDKEITKLFKKGKNDKEILSILIGKGFKNVDGGELKLPVITWRLKKLNLIK